MRKYVGSLIVILAFLIGFAMGTFGLIPFRSSQVNTLIPCPAPAQNQGASYDQGYQAGLDFARIKVSEAGFSRQGPEPIHDFGATVKSVEGQSLRVEIDPMKFDIFHERELVKTIGVTNQTVFERRVQKPIDLYEAEKSTYSKALDAYLAKFKDNPNASTLDQPKPPLFYTIEKILLGDIKSGDRVSIHIPDDLRVSEALVADSVTVNRYVSVVPPDSTNNSSAN